MNKAVLILTILLSLIIFLPFHRALLEYDTKNSGELVRVVIQTLPHCSYGRNEYNTNKFMKVQFQNAYYFITARCRFVQGLQIGQEIEMFHKPGSHLFLFPEQDVTFELLCFAGMYIMIIANIGREYLLKRGKH